MYPLLLFFIFNIVFSTSIKCADAFASMWTTELVFGIRIDPKVKDRCVAAYSKSDGFTGYPYTTASEYGGDASSDTATSGSVDEESESRGRALPALGMPKPGKGKSLAAVWAYHAESEKVLSSPGSGGSTSSDVRRSDRLAQKKLKKE